nr:MAG TPA: hypothetical protein [Caudoviricetes sp.]
MVEEITEIMDESEYTLTSDHMTIQEISAEILRLWATDETMVHDYSDDRFKPTVFLSVADYKNTDKESQFIVGLFEIGKGDLNYVNINYTTGKVKHKEGMFFATVLSLNPDCKLHDVPFKISEELNKSLVNEKVIKRNMYKDIVYEEVKDINGYAKEVIEKKSINMQLVCSLKEE